MNRARGRQQDQLRPVAFQTGYVDYPEGSVLIEIGNTRVLCNASIVEELPDWLERKGGGEGWITGEYNLLPRATNTRNSPEKNFHSSRRHEIKRLVGRALRGAFQRSLLGNRTIYIDCDVIQADGGTRTASITGGYLAARLAIQTLVDRGEIPGEVFLSPVAAISVGVIEGVPLLDLDYSEDRRASVDLNLVMDENGGILEIQGTAEKEKFSSEELNLMLELGRKGVGEILKLMRDHF